MQKDRALWIIVSLIVFLIVVAIDPGVMGSMLVCGSVLAYAAVPIGILLVMAWLYKH